MRDDSTVQFGHATAIRVAVRSSVMQVSSVEIVVKQRQEGPGKIKSAKDKASYHSRQCATRYSPYSISELPVTCSTESEGEPIMCGIVADLSERAVLCSE